MNHWVVRSIVSIAVVAALGVVAGCGGGGGGSGDGGEPGDPTLTATPTHTPAAIATSTPAAATPVGHTPAGSTPTAIGPTPEAPTPSGATPVAPTSTATPTGAETTATVVLHVTTAAPLLGFQFNAFYPTAKGSFTGSAAAVHCTTPSREFFTKNDKDDGTLILSLAHPTGLAFPVTITCTFDVNAGQQLLAADVAIADTEVTDESGAVGDPSTLTVAVDVS